LEEYTEHADFNAYITQSERDAIDLNQTLRSGSSVIVPINPQARCDDFACVKLDEGLRMIVGKRIGDGAMLAKALRFQEPQFDLRKASEYALRWGFIVAPLMEGDEEARRRRNSDSSLGGYGLTCANCGATMDPQNNGPVCQNCGMDNSGGSSGNVGEAAMRELVRELTTGNAANVERILMELARRDAPAPPKPPSLPDGVHALDEWAGKDKWTDPTTEDRQEWEKVHGGTPIDHGVSLHRDDKGYFVHTHRARSDSYESIAKIPKEVIKQIEETGAVT
jgi:hypothetical protein